MSIEHTLSNQFGFTSFLKGQREVIEQIVSGESAAAIFPTGAGKSLCYQLPALHLPGLTLLVSPLLSLMKDQLEFLLSKNVAAAKLDSTMPADDYHAALQVAKMGQIKILMISVERLKNERFRTQLKQMNVSLLVVDEAHCISEWGHNFRPDYLKIPTYQKEFNISQVLLLTATATPRVIDDMSDKFNIPSDNVHVTGFYRSNLELQVLPVFEKDKNDKLVKILSASPTGPGIVYVTRQKTAEEVAEMLSSRGFIAEAYHAGMDSNKREEVQNQFMNGRLGIVVATIAFGMGIDKRDIRKVIHYDLPKSIENYSQEIGRAGRDNDPSLCCILANRDGVPILENFTYGDTPEPNGIQYALEFIKQSGNRALEVKAYQLSRDSGIRILPLKTLFVYLEMKGIIIPKYIYLESYPFKLIKSQEEILSNFKGERNSFVKAIFKNSKTAKVWTSPDINSIVNDSRCSRGRVVTALEYFDEQGWIELKPKSSVEVFEILKPDFPLQETIDWMYSLFKAKESTEIERIHNMIQLFEKPSCLAMNLSLYFGEHLSVPCGKCSFCRTGNPIELPSRNIPALSSFVFNDALQHFFEIMGSQISEDLITRFLCGINTPRLLNKKTTKLPNFGLLEIYPYKTVLKWVSKNLKNG